MDKKDRASVENKIKQIISERLEVKAEAIKPESELRNDLGIDSFGLVELAYEIKNKFGLKIDTRDFKSIITVNDAVNYIFRRIK